MIEKKVADLTVSELRALIAEEIASQLAITRLQVDRSPHKRSLDEVMESIERHRWTPPPGLPSTLQMLREDRDS